MKRSDPLQTFRAFVAEHGSQKAAAKALGISQVYVSDLLAQRRDFSDQMLEKLGLKRVVVSK